MKNKKYYSSYAIAIEAMSGLLLGCSALYYFGYTNENPNLFWLVGSLVALVIVFVYHKLTTYIEIINEREIINRGYNDTWRTPIEIKRIHFVLRAPQFLVKFFGGSLMIIYVRETDGVLRYSALREVSYTQQTLKSFLTELKRINPNIVLDPEYEQFLEGTYSLRTITQNTMRSVEQKLQDKGERW